VFTPDANFNGVATFDYTVSDGAGGTSTSTVTVDVAAVNDAPVVGAPSFVTLEDTALTVTAAELLAGSSDLDGDALSVSGVSLSSPAAGSLVDNLDGTWTFTPAADWNGALSLDYAVSDGTASVPASAALTVSAVNDNPVAVADSAATSEDVQVTITAASLLANDTDVDGDTLSLASVSNALGGTVGLDVNGDVVFTPDANFNGVATFDYTVSDGAGGTSTSTVTVDVAAVNDAPVALTTNIAADEDIAVSGSISATDVEGDSLTYALVQSPAQGTMTLNPDGAYVFDPNSAFEALNEGETADVSFTYSVSDGIDTVLKTATIQVAGHTDIISGFAIDGYINGGTIFGDANSNGIWDTGEAFATTGPDGSFTLTGAQGPLVLTGGTDASTLEAFRGTLRAPVGASVITPLTTLMATLVDNGYDYATAQTMVQSAFGIQPSIDLGSFDPVAAVLSTDPALVEAGEMVMAAGVLVQNAIVQMSAAIAGGSALNIQDAGLSVSKALADRIAVLGTAIDLTDVFGLQEVLTQAAVHAGLSGVGLTALTSSADEVSVIISEGSAQLYAVANSTVTGADLLRELARVGKVSQTDAANAIEVAMAAGDQAALDSAVASFTGVNLDTAIGEALVSAGVSSINDAPVAFNDAYSVAEDTILRISPASLVVNDIDANGDALTILGIGSAQGGTVSIDTNGDIIFTPLPDFNGAASFEYTISDGRGGFATAGVSVDVSPVNDNPVAVSDALRTNEDTAVTFSAADLLANDSDIDSSDVLSIASIDASGAQGSVTDNLDGTFSYDPGAAFQFLAVGETASETFSYTVSDGNGGLATSTVTMTVTGTNDGPVAVADSGATDEDTTITLDVLANDSDVDLSDTHTVDAVSVTNGLGAASITANQVVYDPIAYQFLAEGEIAQVELSYTMSDQHGAASTSTVSITITGANDGPIAVVDNLGTIDAYSTLQISTADLLGNDYDIDASDVLSIVSVENATNGQVVMTESGEIFFQPDLGYAGTASFEYTVSDGNGGTTTATASIESFLPANLIKGTDGKDKLKGNKDPNVIDGLAGDDKLKGKNGNDILVGGAGDDKMSGGHGDDVFLVSGANNGVDEFEGGKGFDTIRGSIGDDVIGMEEFENDNGIDLIDGGLGTNVIQGTANDDELDFSHTTLTTIDLIDGGAGDDEIEGSTGNDIIEGGAGDDELEGGAGNDTFLVNGQNNGFDEIEGGSGFDQILGSGGDDVIGIRGHGDDGHGDDDWDDEHGSKSYHDPDAGFSIEEIDGGAGFNTIQGSSHGDQLDFSQTTLKNIDLINGGAGNDKIIGSAAHDMIFGGAGNDKIDGGDGVDTAAFSGSSEEYKISQHREGSVVVQDARRGHDCHDRDDHDGSQYTDGKDTLANIEQLQFSDQTIYLATNDAKGGGDDQGMILAIGDYASNSISFQSSIDYDQLWFAQSGEDLVISVIGTDNQVALKDWYASADNQVATIQTADGHVLDHSSVSSLVNAMGGMTPPPVGQTELTETTLNTLTPVLAANWRT